MPDVFGHGFFSTCVAWLAVAVAVVAFFQNNFFSLCFFLEVLQLNGFAAALRVQHVCCFRILVI